jgi:hypothetical protein
VAHLLATASAYGLARWQLEGRWPHSTTRALPPPPPRHVEMWIGLGAATLILALTAAWEATDIINAVG